MTDMKLYGPFTVFITIALTNGVDTAEAEYQIPRTGKITVAAMREAATEAEKEVKAQMGEEWRLCNKREFFDTITNQATVNSGVQFAMPGSEVKWDD